MSATREDWRWLDGVLTAWFEASSLTEAAAFAGRVRELSPQHLVDLRASGLRVRLASVEDAAPVSAAAREQGLVAAPAGLQQLSVLVDAVDPAVVARFWQRVLAYEAVDGGLADPWRRDPALRLRPTTEHRPLRNRLHLDVGRPAAAVEQVDGEATGPYGVCRRDPEGNEVDLVPGGALTEADDTDWQALFSAMVCYRVDSGTQERELVTAAAELAERAGFPLLIDLRDGLVIMDSGKDLWEAGAPGLDVDFVALAGQLQRAARDLGATAEATAPRFVQLFVDAADVPAVRAFWLAVLGYREDPREGVTDIVDPRRLQPVLVLQELDVADSDRRQQRNRVHVELTVPADDVPGRLATAVAAGGRVLDGDEPVWRIADPEGNELLIIGEGG